MNGRDIVMMSLQNWGESLGSNSYNLAIEFSQQNRVLYINRAPDRISQLRNVFNGKIAIRDEEWISNPRKNIHVLHTKSIMESINRLPKIIFKRKIDDSSQPTFGMYVNGENTLYVALVNRHPNDILRTIAHELQHYKQDTEHKLNDESGITGSPEENEANAMAGIVMRHFNKRYPEYLSDRPVITESK
jgi:hypothetical protein